MTTSRWLDLSLEEVLGGARAPDLRYRVLAASESDRVAAQTRFELAQYAEPSLRTAGPSLLTVAAMVVLSVFVLGGTFALGRSTASGSPVQGLNVQGVNVQGVSVQDPKARSKLQEVAPKDHAELVKLLGELRTVTVTQRMMTRHGVLMVLSGKHPVSLPAKMLPPLKAALANGKPQPESGLHAELTSVELHLAKGRFVAGYVDITARHALVVPGVGRYQLSAEVTRALRETAADSALRFRQIAGIVFGPDELRLSGERGLPRSHRSLRTFDLKPADLAVTAEFKDLRSLDLCGSRLQPDRRLVERVAGVPRLERLVLSAKRLPRTLEPVKRLQQLVVTTEAAHAEAILPARCYMCHAGPTEPRALARPDGEALSKILQMGGLRHVGLRGMVVPEEVFKILPRLPGIRVLDLSFSSLGQVDIEVLGRLPVLEEVILMGAQDLPEDLLETLAKLKQLKVLDLSRVRRLDREGLFRLEERLPKCRIVVSGDG